MHAPLYASHRNKRMDQWLKMLSEGAPFEPAIVWYYSPRITSRAVASSLHLVWANVGLGRPPSWRARGGSARPGLPSSRTASTSVL